MGKYAGLPVHAVVLSISAALAACGGKGGGGDADTDGDVPGDDAADDADGGDGDATPDADADAEEDGSDAADAVEEEDWHVPCTVPGLTVGTPVEVADPGAVIGGLSLARAGGVMGLAWTDGRIVDVIPNEEIYFHLIDPAGTLAGSEIRISNEDLESRAPSVAWTGSAFGMAWGDARGLPAGDVFWAAVDEGGDVAVPEVQVTTGGVGAMYAATAWSGSRVGIAWTDNRDGTMDVYFALADAAGALDGGISRVSDAAGNSFGPALAWTGAGWIVAWDDTAGGASWEPHVMLAALSPDGAVDAAGARISGDTGTANHATVAFAHGVAFACWEDFDAGAHDVFCGAYTAAGVESVAPAAVAATAGDSTSPSLAASPLGVGLAWADENGTAGDDEIHFALLGTDLSVTGGDAPITDTPGEIAHVSLSGTPLGWAVAFADVDASGDGSDVLVYLPFTYCP